MICFLHLKIIKCADDTKPYIDYAESNCCTNVMLAWNNFMKLNADKFQQIVLVYQPFDA